MGLDFIVQRKRKGEAYEASAWEDVVIGRNCHTAKEVVLDNISTYDEEKNMAKLTIGTMNQLVFKLSEKLQEFDLNDKDVFYDAAYSKTMAFLSELAKALAVAAIDYEFDGIEYDFRLIDSY